MRDAGSWRGIDERIATNTYVKNKPTDATELFRPRHLSEASLFNLSRIGVRLVEHPREPIQMENVGPGRMHHELRRI
jgi:hypothetical protein